MPVNMPTANANIAFIYPPITIIAAITNKPNRPEIMFNVKTPPF